MTPNIEAPGTGARKRWIGLAVLAAGPMTINDGTGTGAAIAMAGT